MFSDYWHLSLVVGVAILILSAVGLLFLRTSIKFAVAFAIIGSVIAGFALTRIHAQQTEQQAAISKD